MGKWVRRLRKDGGCKKEWPCLWGLSPSYCANDGEDPGACSYLCLHPGESEKRRVIEHEAKASVDI